MKAVSFTPLIIIFPQNKRSAPGRENKLQFAKKKTFQFRMSVKFRYVIFCLPPPFFGKIFIF